MVENFGFTPLCRCLSFICAVLGWGPSWNIFQTKVCPQLVLLIPSPPPHFTPSFLLPRCATLLPALQTAGGWQTPLLYSPSSLVGALFLESLEYIQLGCHFCDWWASITCAISVFITKLWLLTLSHLEWYYVLNVCFSRLHSCLVKSSITTLIFFLIFFFSCLNQLKTLALHWVFVSLDLEMVLR